MAPALTSMDLSNATRLSYIGSGAFRQGLAGDIHVIFPASELTYVGQEVFGNCNTANIIDITFGGDGDYLDFSKLGYSNPIVRSGSNYHQIYNIFCM